MSGSERRRRPHSKRQKLASLLSHAEDSFKMQSIGRARECYNFFADFWLSTPHPTAQMAFVLGWAALVVVLNDERVLDAGIVLDDQGGRTMTTILAFLIVFRTNQSYNRWWEGRILWGKMHWSCVELAQQAATWIENPELAQRIMNFGIAFAYTVKQILRREELSSHDLDGIVEAAEVERINTLALPVMPYYCTDVIRQCMKKGLTEHPQTFGVQAVARGMDMPVSQLAAQFSDMARVRNTPQPDCFRVMLHMFTVIYLLLLPVISYEALGYWVIPEVLVTSFLMLGLQLAASDLEDPFGYDLSDLELDLYVANIAKECRAAFYMGLKGGIDLTTRDGGAGADAMRSSQGVNGGAARVGSYGSTSHIMEAVYSISRRHRRSGSSTGGDGKLGSIDDNIANGISMGGSRNIVAGSGGGEAAGSGGGEEGGGNATEWPLPSTRDISAPASLSPSGSIAVTNKFPLASPANGAFEDGGDEGYVKKNHGRDKENTINGGGDDAQTSNARRPGYLSQTPTEGVACGVVSNDAGKAQREVSGHPASPPPYTVALHAGLIPPRAPPTLPHQQPELYPLPSPSEPPSSANSERGRSQGTPVDGACPASSFSARTYVSPSSHGRARVRPLSIRQRTQEDVAPRRRSRSRPGRGRAPDEEEGSSATTSPAARSHYDFEQQGNVARAAVV